MAFSTGRIAVVHAQLHTTSITGEYCYRGIIFTIGASRAKFKKALGSAPWEIHKQRHRYSALFYPDGISFPHRARRSIFG